MLGIVFLLIFYMRTAQIQSFCHCLHIITTLLHSFFICFNSRIHIYQSLDKYTYKPLCRAANLSCSKSAPPAPKTSCLWMRIRNNHWSGLVGGLNPKQGLVEGCPNPLHSCRVKGKFYKWQDTHLYNTLFKMKNRSFCASYVITLFLHHCTCAVLLVSVFNPIEYLHEAFSVRLSVNPIPNVLF